MQQKQIEKIKNLYLSGCSIFETAEKVKMSSSGVRYILVKEKIKIRLRSDAVRIKHHKKLNSQTSFIPSKIPKNLKDLYFISLALYWGEGSKGGNTVAITNSDPQLILVFLRFLRKICKVDDKRLHILIHHHLDLDEKDLISYWSNLTKINKSQFYKSTLHKNISKNSTKSLKFGTISLRYSDSLLLGDILDRIEKLKISTLE